MASRILRVSLESRPLHSLASLDNLLQSGFWGRFKAAGGWKSLAFHWNFEGKEGDVLVFERKVARILPLGYVPFGPELPGDWNAEEQSLFLDLLAKELQGELSLGCLFIRFDLLGGTGGPVGSPEAEDRPTPLERPLRTSPYRVQPPDTVVLPLDADEDALLAGMHKKTRYNIRLATKKGVEIEHLEGSAAEESLTLWYGLYKETAQRDGIALHGESYYRRLFHLAQDAQGPFPKLSLFLARHDGDLLAGIILAVHGRRATYLYGASGNLKRELMPNHLLQWEAIRHAKAAGAREYDFFGIPPADDPKHPMHGLWRFKTGFGGNIIHNLGAWDRPFSWLFYPLYRLAETLRGLLAAWRKRRR